MAKMAKISLSSKTLTYLGMEKESLVAMDVLEQFFMTFVTQRT